MHSTACMTLLIMAGSLVAACGGPSAVSPSPSGAAASATPAAAATPSLDVTSVMPPPSGDLAVGVRDLDPVATGFASRAWYPAIPDTGTPGAPYMTDAAWLAYGDAPEYTATSLARMRTSASTDATPAPGESPRPVVLLLSGWSQPGASLTVLATDLASHGYVVVSIDPPWMAERTGAVSEAAEDAARLEAVRGLLPTLTEPAMTELVGPIDGTRVAVGGHSFGSGIAFKSSVGEPAVRAVFALDGPSPIGQKPVKVPALVIATTTGGLSGDAEIMALLGATPALVTVGLRDSGHCDVSDMPLVHVATGTPPTADSTWCYGKIGVAGAAETAVIVGRFLDAALGTPSTLPTPESLIKDLPDGTLDPLGLGH
jgi:dienelactone hydrolase